MAASTATGVFAEGGTLSHSTTSGGTYTAFASVISMDFPGSTQELVPFKTLGSNLNQYIPGYIEPGDFSFTSVYLNLSRSVLDAMKGTTVWFKITYPVEAGQTVAATDVFSGIVLENAEALDADNKIIEIKTKCKATSVPTFVVGS